jgi:hypothetical protein
MRSRSIQAVLVLGLLLVGVAYLSAAFSPRQPKTVALDVGLSEFVCPWSCSPCSGSRNWWGAR